ncbi:MOSC domain-containing protein [Nakamurella antarctica]|uniref:MOSC domain-containing protein n=1 Tax=Nakamurella antarctica TaxID=1902245 RepID=A0A3G8ZIT9_9ACTN|nr:MOSC domain-containing protein [Nakamurella antarctica]AZI57098.1 MOSC domain-containing protein [Nakamurella antarctica]
MSRDPHQTHLLGAIASLAVGPVDAVQHGRVEVPTAFRKLQTHGRTQLGPTGLAGDTQADLTVHGGPEKAVCVYPLEHYGHWEALLGVPLSPPAFGENITSKGLLEAEVFLGDIFTWGTAVVQVSQPRRPCFKIAAIHRRKDLAVLVEDSLRTGFYFRVLQPGFVQQEDPVTLTDVSPVGVSVRDVSQAMNGAKAGLLREDRIALLRRVLRSASVLPERWVPGLRSDLAELMEGPPETGFDAAASAAASESPVASGESARLLGPRDA